MKPTNPRFHCQGCKSDVSGSPKAVIHIRHAEVSEVEQARKEWNQRNKPDDGLVFLTLRELRSHPDPAQWAVHCDACNPHKDEYGEMCGGCYWFSLDRCRSAVDLLYWTAHLMEKDWIEETNWSEVVRKAAMSTGRADP